MERPRVSILIPTKDAGATLGTTLERIASQRAPFSYETVAVDSGSQDGTLERLAAAGVRVNRIPPESFGHGRTRNLGVTMCRGETVVLLVQDAVPDSDGWLAALVAPLESNSRIAGSFARQKAHPDADAVTRCNLARWVAGREQGRVSGLDRREAWQSLSPLERHDLCAFDNVCSCIRRSVWEQHPFPDIPIAEDLAWGREVVLAGFLLAYEPQAVVVHSHQRSWRYELRRTYVLHRQLAGLVGLRSVPTRRCLLRAVGMSVGSHLRCLWRAQGAQVSPSTLMRALALAVVWPLGQYLGGRAFFEGHDSLRAEGV